MVEILVGIGIPQQLLKSMRVKLQLVSLKIKDYLGRQRLKRFKSNILLLLHQKDAAAY